MALPRRTTRGSLRRGSSEARTSRTASRVGVGLIVLALLFIGGGVWFYQSQQSELVELNPVDLCPRDTTRTPPSIYVVLIDQTDPLPELQRRSITNQVLSQMRTDLESEGSATSMRHARVEIWSFNDRQPGSTDGVFRVGDVELTLRKLLSLCNPGAPERWDHLYKNVDVVKRRHQRFHSDVEAQLLESLGFPEAKQSPVLEAVYGIGVSVFGAPQVRSAQKRLIVVSDLMQNTKTLSFFSGPVDYTEWQKRREARATKPHLKDVSITVLMIPGTRPDLQKGWVGTFWSSVFLDAGASRDLNLRRTQ